MSKARIFPRPLNAMQSGKAHPGEWMLQYQPSDRQTHDPMTGWPGSADTNRQLRLSFESREAAIAFAESKALDFQVEDAPVHRLKIQAYSDNFR